MKTLLTAITLSIATLGFIGCSATNDKKDVVNPSDPTPTPNPNPNPTTPTGPSSLETLPEVKLDADSYGDFKVSTFSNDVKELVTSASIVTIENDLMIPVTTGYYKHGTYDTTGTGSGSYYANSYPFSEYIMRDVMLLPGDSFQRPYQPPIHSDVKGKPYRRLDGDTIIYDNYKPGKSLLITRPDRWLLEARGGSQEWQNNAFEKMFCPEEIDSNISNGLYIGATGGTKYYGAITDSQESLYEIIYKGRVHWFATNGNLMNTDGKTIQTGLSKIDCAVMTAKTIVFTGTKNGSPAVYCGSTSLKTPEITQNQVKKISDRALLGGNQFSIMDDGLLLGAEFVYYYQGHEIGFFKESPAVKAGVKTEYGIKKLECGAHIMVEATKDGQPNFAQFAIHYFTPKRYINVINGTLTTVAKDSLQGQPAFCLRRDPGFSIRIVNDAGQLTSSYTGANIKMNYGYDNWDVKLPVTDKPSKRKIELFCEGMKTEVTAWVNAEKSF